jgi:hypothetical protein
MSIGVKFTRRTKITLVLTAIIIVISAFILKTSRPKKEFVEFHALKITKKYIKENCKSSELFVFKIHNIDSFENELIFTIIIEFNENKITSSIIGVNNKISLLNRYFLWGWYGRPECEKIQNFKAK